LLAGYAADLKNCWLPSGRRYKLWFGASRPYVDATLMMLPEPRSAIT
jgi:hypothetical protein